MSLTSDLAVILPWDHAKRVGVGAGNDRCLILLAVELQAPARHVRRIEWRLVMSSDAS